MTKDSAQTRPLLLRPRFWIIILALILISLPYYAQAPPHPGFLTDLLRTAGLNRHSFERILYLIPILLTGFWFGSKSVFIISLVVLALMLPGALLDSSDRVDAVFESCAIFATGAAISIVFAALQRERAQRGILEKEEQKLRTSEAKFRHLYDYAHEAVFVHERDGRIVAVNRACSTLTGYGLEELLKLKMADLVPEEDWLVIAAAEQYILSGAEPGNTLETKLIKKNGQQIAARISIDLAYGSDQASSIQCTVHDLSAERRLQENLQYYVQQATRAQEEERKRIALELHDTTIQDLIVLSRRLDTLSTKSKGLPGEQADALKELRQQTLAIIQSLRRMSQDLRPATLDRLGLLPALGFLASEVTKASHIDVKVSIQGQARRLPEEVELTLFRIAQEALMNIWKHSEATQSEITIEFSPEKTKLAVADNGKGFNMPDTAVHIAREGRLGLMGMEERARLIGAHLVISSAPGAGTVVTVEVPST